MDDLLNQAIRHHQAGALKQAELLYQKIGPQDHGYADALHYLGVIAYQRGQFDRAIALIRQSIAIRPDYADAYGNLGNVFTSRGDAQQAIDAFVKAVSLKPDYWEAHYNLGVLYKRLWRYDDAMASVQRAIALNPSLSDAFSHLGNVHKDCGRIDEAIAAFSRASALSPMHPVFKSNVVYALLFKPRVSLQTIGAELRGWNAAFSEPLSKLIKPHLNQPQKAKRLRIGYVSPDFRDHVVGRNIAPLLSAANRTDFEVYCYSLTTRPDRFTDRLKSLADQWRESASLSDEQTAEQIRRDQIDVLVDLTLHLSENRLQIFARKPAPVQVTFAGYPGSTGVRTIDYRLTDPYLEPADADLSSYCEQPYRLANSFWCYDPLDCRDIAVNELPSLATGIVTFGCLCSFSKVNEHVLTLWASVMRQVANSRLLLLTPPGSHRQATVNRMEREGIASDRITFATPRPRRDYLELYHQIDIGLDSFPYNGHTTSLDSMWMGVPVVTLVGENPVSRAGLSQWSNIGMPEFACTTPNRFVETAVTLAQDGARLQKLRRELRQRMEQSPLMDAQKFARDIEDAYRDMWIKWCDKSSRQT